MNKGRLLWMLVLADLLLSFASVGSEAFFGWTLPPALLAYQHSRVTDFSINGIGDVMQLGLLAAACLVAFAAWIGLVGYWRYARGLYLLACGIWLMQVVFEGAVVMLGISLAFRMLNALVSGLIIGLVYFTDLARRFEAQPIESSAPTPNLGAGRA